MSTKKENEAKYTEAIAHLRDNVPAGATVYGIVQSVARSGEHDHKANGGRDCLIHN